jgi:hypothetical protein
MVAVARTRTELAGREQVLSTRTSWVEVVTRDRRAGRLS